MRFAVISDIHGNMFALNEVLKDIEAQKCDKILCLGDLALGGPEPAKTVDFVMEQNWDIIQGNTDELIGNHTPELCEKVKLMYSAMGCAMESTVKLLSERHFEYLKNNPEQKEFEIDGVKTLMVHGSPRKNNENIFPDMPIEKVEEMLEGVEASLILCGHTHTPCGYQTNNGKTVVNVGSVGRSMVPDARACYAVIDFNNGKYTVEHRLVPYNNVKAAEIMAARSFEGAKDIAELLLNPTKRHV